MPKTVDITNDDERDTTNGGDDQDQGGEDDDQSGQDKGKDKGAATAEALAQQQAAITRLTQSVQALTSKVGSPTVAERKEQLSETEEAIKMLLASGYKPEHLEAVVTLVAATRKDIKAELTKEYQATEKQKGAQSLDEQCYSRTSDVLDRILDGHPMASDDDFRDMMTRKIQKTMESHDDFDSARNAYASGKPPTSKDIEKAARLVLQKMPKEFAMNTRDNSNSQQLDVKNSRPAANHPAISKNGDVDVNKLTDYEREIYTVALNATKNKEIALHALKNIGMKGR